jgi:PAS domain S-box-containing protein
MSVPDGAGDRPRRTTPGGAAHASSARDAASVAGGGPAGVAEGAGLYQLLVESVRDYAIFVLDVGGHILSWNAGARHIKGYTAEEIIGRHFSTFYPAADVAAGKPQWELEVAVREGRFEEEGWRIRKDGGRFWANVLITPLHDESGMLVGFAKVTRDLTERRRAELELRSSEQRFRLLVQSVRDYGIFMLDAQGHIASWNEGARSIKGYSAEDIIGRHFSTFYPEEDVRAGKPRWELEVATAEGRFEEEGWRVRKDGSLFWANVVITALRDEMGTLVGFAKVTRDLTERRASQQRAVEDARRLAEAEASSRTKSEFLRAMSHELRTPINATIGYAELIDLGIRGPVTEEQREYLARIRSSQEHLLGIITDLLNYSRIEAGQLRYDLAPVPVHVLVDAVLAMVEPQATAKGLVIEHGACAAGLVALADRTKTEQIVLNLLSNAVKFTLEGGRITVSCAPRRDQVAVVVTDTGPGIPAAQQGAIFEPFVQLGRSLTSAHEGTGLGLSISRDLARAMGGDVSVESVEGEGATFTLALPAA